jgi:hypothetical protein
MNSDAIIGVIVLVVLSGIIVNVSVFIVRWWMIFRNFRGPIESVHSATNNESQIGSITNSTSTTTPILTSTPTSVDTIMPTPSITPFAANSEQARVINISNTGSVYIPEFSSDSPTIININSGPNEAQLELRIAILEGYLEWILNNGIFVRSIEQYEIDTIKQKAVQNIHERFPDAEVSIEQKQQS